MHSASNFQGVKVAIKWLYEESGTVDRLATRVADWEASDDVQSILVLGCAGDGWTPAAIDPLLTGAGKPIWGGLFPRIICYGQHHEHGFIMLGLPNEPDGLVIPQLSSATTDFAAALTPVADRWTSGETDAGMTDTATFMILVDGLSRRIGDLVEQLFMQLGLRHHFFGGGAGSLNQSGAPCLLTPGGMLADAALVVRLPLASGVGVAHGWSPISDSFRVTESRHNIIHTLDWSPAAEIYHAQVQAHSGHQVERASFADWAKAYPFGINKWDSEEVVRDPIAETADGGLVCVGDVPKGSFVRIMTGSPTALIAAAGQARQRAEQSHPSPVSPPAVALLMDCISRALFLESRFTDELHAAAGPQDLMGAATLGEIASSGSDYLEFFNKTAVVTYLYPC